MDREKARAGIYSLAAIYMAYIAYQLYQEGNMVAMLFFVIAAIGLIIFSMIIAKRVTDREKALTEEKKDDESETTGKRVD